MIIITDSDYKEIVQKAIPQSVLQGTIQKLKPVIAAMDKFEADMKNATVISEEVGTYLMRILVETKGNPLKLSDILSAWETAKKKKTKNNLVVPKKKRKKN